MQIDSYLRSAAELLEIPSTTDNPNELREVTSYMAERLAQHEGVTIEHFSQNDKPSMLAYIGNERPNTFDVILNGHLDVVPGREEQYALDRQGDKLYGRGAIDMKLAALVMSDVFTELAGTLPIKLGLQLVTDEEAGGHDGTKVLYDAGIRTKFMIAGEPTGLNICTQLKGLCRLRIKAGGRTAHGAYPWLGENATIKLVDLVNKLLEHYPVPEKEVWRTTVNVSAIHTPNTTTNKVPDDATLILDIRPVSDDPNFQTEATVRALFKKLAPDLEIEFITPLDPPHVANPKNPAFMALEAAITDVKGDAPEHIRRHGTADIRFYGDCAVSFGPKGEGLHADVEYVSLASLQQYEEILTKFLVSLGK